MVARETNIVNAFETTLAAQLAQGGTTMELAQDPGVDSPAYFVIDPDDDSNREVVLWSSGSNHASATVVRDMDGKHGTAEDASTAPTHASGTKVRLAVVKQHIQEAHDAIQQGFVLEDGDGTEVTINPAVASGVYTQREVKFVDGNGIDINWTDVSDGTDGDPYDLTFGVDIANATELASGLALTDELLVSDAGDIKRMDVSLIADAIDGAGIDASAGTLVNAAVGKQSMWIPASAMYPSTTTGCSALTQVETTAGRPDLKVLDFADGADSYAQFSIAMPSFWNENTITFQSYFTVTGTDTGTVQFALEGLAVSSDDTINTAFSNPAVHTALAHSGTSNDLMVSAESAACTIQGSPAAGDNVFFRITRDVSGDTQTGAARLIGIKIFYTVDDVHEA
jgi:hypothetical protein